MKSQVLFGCKTVIWHPLATSCRLRHAIVQTAERRAKGQVADNVKGGPVQPVDQILRALAGLVTEADDQLGNVALQEGLLLAQRPLREGRGQRFADAGVLGPRRGNDGVGAAHRWHEAGALEVLGHLDITVAITRWCDITILYSVSCMDAHRPRGRDDLGCVLYAR